MSAGLRQIATANLAISGARQGIDENDFTRTLVGGQMGVGMGQQRRGVQPVRFVGITRHDKSGDDADLIAHP